MGNDTIVSFSNPAFRDELSDLVRERAADHRPGGGGGVERFSPSARGRARRNGPASGGAKRLPAAAAGLDGRWAGDGAVAEDPGPRR